MYATRYRLPPSARPLVAERRVAIVDDVMSAGSAIRGTLTELETHEANVVAAGALLVLGDVGERFLADRGVGVCAVWREPYQLWAPHECPLCADGIPLERASAS